ncbi:hypothetical protein ACX8XK_01115 [Serratia marcescens]|uniref:hypothetical protein n=1 Tax=Serratia sp. CY38905 TaxID=3383613 RepID=UPI003F9FE433
MVTFINDEYAKEVEKTNAHIEARYSDYNMDVYKITEKTSGDTFIKAIIYSSWKGFYFRFTNDKFSLDNNTVFNKKHLGERVLLNLEALTNSESLFLNILLRIMGEYHFWLNSPGDYPGYLNSRVLERLDREIPESNFTGEFLWIERSMPASIARDFIQSSDFKDVMKLKEDIASVESKVKGVVETEISSLDENLKGKKEEVEKLLGKTEESMVSLQSYKEKLDNYKGEFNFVLLSKAFSRMKRDKENEFKAARRWMNAYTAALISIPILILIAVFRKMLNVNFDIEILIYAIPLLTLEALIFYFMRIYYGEVRSIRAQLLQIDLRLSLCEFIHDFIDKKNESKDHGDSWGNFENLIFSPIQMSAENIPSVLDGANAVADVLGKVMPKK